MPKGKKFSEEERVRLRELVLKYKDVVENRQSDCVSVNKKKVAWDTICAEFNSNHNYTSRNVEQLKKLWENIKFRRKADFAAEKRNLLKTGGGPAPDSFVTPDPELDACGIDIEIPDTIDSNTVQLVHNNSSHEYMFVDNVLVPEIECNTLMIDESTPKGNRAHDNSQVQKGSQERNRRKSNVCTPEAELRVERAQYMLNLDKELGEMRKEELRLKIEEQRLKIDLLKQQLQTARKEEEFQLVKRNIETDILKNKFKPTTVVPEKEDELAADY